MPFCLKEIENYQYRFIRIVRDDLILVEDQMTKQEYQIQIKQLIQFDAIMAAFSFDDQLRILSLSKSK